MSINDSCFVYLHFRPMTQTGETAGTIPLLVSAQNGKLNVVIRSDWAKGISLRDRDYLEGLLEDWRTADASQACSIVEQLAQASIGPLRAIETGTAMNSERQSLLEAAACTGKDDKI